MFNVCPCCHALDPLVSSWWIGDALNWFHNVSTYDGEVIEYWTILSWKNHLIKTKYYRGIWAHSWYCWKAFNEHNLMKVIWKVLEGAFGFWRVFFIENSTELRKWFWKEKLVGT